MATFILQAESGPDAGRAFTIPPAGGIIGRHASADIVLGDVQTSRRHARLEVRNDAIVIHDLGSANGTRVNAAPLTAPLILRLGDTIALGATTLRVAPVDTATLIATPALPPAQPDQELVALAQGGDGEAFALLVRRHERGIYAFAYRFFNDPLDADDAVQETFARAYSRLATYAPAGRFGSWLLAICAHWCIDALRARRRRVRTIALGALPEGDYFISESAGPEEYALRLTGREEVQGWIASLPPEYRTVLAMHYSQGRSYGEIATALGLPLTTVRMRLFRARAALRTIATA